MQPIFAGLLGQRPELRRGGFDPPLLLRPRRPWSAPQSSRTQSWALMLVPLEHVEDDPRLAVQLAGGDPEGVERDAVPLEGLDLGVERRDVLGPPVVGEVLEPQPLEHRRPLLGRPLLRVERDDAPGDEVVAGEEVFVLRVFVRGCCRGRIGKFVWQQ